MSLFLLILVNLLHPIYVSFTEINHNPKTQNLEISSRIFTDDLNNAIAQEQNLKLNILESKDSKKVQLSIGNYLNKHLKIIINSKEVKTNFISYEIKGDAIWCYLEVKNIQKVTAIKLVNSLLYGLHQNQTNIVEVYVNGTSRTFKLDEPDAHVEANF